MRSAGIPYTTVRGNFVSLTHKPLYRPPFRVPASSRARRARLRLPLALSVPLTLARNDDRLQLLRKVHVVTGADRNNCVTLIASLSLGVVLPPFTCLARRVLQGPFKGTSTLH